MLTRSIARASAAAIACLCAKTVLAAVVAPVPKDVTVKLMRGSAALTTDPRDGTSLTGVLTAANCANIRDAIIDFDGLTRETGANVYKCVIEQRAMVTFRANTCPALPAPEGRVVNCPAGFMGSYTQTRSYSRAPYPTCAVLGEWTPRTPPASCVPVDTDNDGVPDSTDECPTVHASTPNGCPAPPPIACANRVCRLSWTHAGTPAAGFRMVYGQRADQLTGSVQVTPGTVTTGEVTVTAAGTWYFAVIAFGGGNDSPLSNIQSQEVQ